MAGPHNFKRLFEGYDMVLRLGVRMNNKVIMSTVLSDRTHLKVGSHFPLLHHRDADAMRLVGERAHAAAAIIQTGDTFDASSPAKTSHLTRANSP